MCEGFRRGWGTYISTYLFAKMSTLLIVAVFDPDNCFFRTMSRTTVPIIRQTLLLVSTLAFFISQSTFAPFLDPVNNASEWTSRLNYLSTSTTALVITLSIPAKEIFESYVLYTWVPVAFKGRIWPKNLHSIYIITYGLGFCMFCSESHSNKFWHYLDFTLVNFGWMQRLIKSVYSFLFSTCSVSNCFLQDWLDGLTSVSAIVACYTTFFYW